MLRVKERVVKCYDAYKKELFDLHAMLLQTIHDMLALGNIKEKNKGRCRVRHMHG